jgi:hypothetical protein
MGDDIIKTFSVMEKGELILQSGTDTTSFRVLGEGGEFGRVCVQTDLAAGDYTLSVNGENTLTYSDSDNVEHCYHRLNDGGSQEYSYIELDFDSANRQSDKVTFTLLSLEGNNTDQEIIWKLED